MLLLATYKLCSFLRFLQTADYSTQIFSLGVLLSSLLVFNQVGTRPIQCPVQAGWGSAQPNSSMANELCLHILQLGITLRRTFSMGALLAFRGLHAELLHARGAQQVKRP